MYPLLHPTTLESIETTNIKRKLDLQLTIGDASIKGDPFDMFAEIHFKSTFYSYKSLILKYTHKHFITVGNLSELNINMFEKKLLFFQNSRV